MKTTFLGFVGAISLVVAFLGLHPLLLLAMAGGQRAAKRHGQHMQSEQRNRLPVKQDFAWKEKVKRPRSGHEGVKDSGMMDSCADKGAPTSRLFLSYIENCGKDLPSRFGPV